MSTETGWRENICPSTLLFSLVAEIYSKGEYATVSAVMVCMRLSGVQKHGFVVSASLNVCFNEQANRKVL